MNNESKKRVEVEVCLSPISGVLDGDKIQEWLDARSEKNASVKGVLDILVERGFETMVHFRQDNPNMVYPVYVATLYSGGMSFLSPVKFNTDEERFGFYECMSDIIYDIGEQRSDKPIMSILVAEGWTCSVRKDQEKAIRNFMNEKCPDADINKVCEALVASCVEQFGSIADIPEDHPYVKRYEILSVVAGFLGMDGPVIATKLKMTDSSIAQEVIGGLTEMCESYSVMPRNTGRIQFDLSEYEPVNFKESEFNPNAQI
jgi:hypothetical protein